MNPVKAFVVTAPDYIGHSEYGLTIVASSQEEAVEKLRQYFSIYEANSNRLKLLERGDFFRFYETTVLL